MNVKLPRLIQLYDILLPTKAHTTSNYVYIALAFIMALPFFNTFVAAHLGLQGTGTLVL